MFSPESCQAIVDMGNVELIELKKPEINAHRVCTTYLREQLYVHVEKHLRSNQEMIARMQKVFLLLSRRLSILHLVHIREVTSTDINHGNSIITKPLMRWVCTISWPHHAPEKETRIPRSENCEHRSSATIAKKWKLDIFQRIKGSDWMTNWS